jgi:hypothetical protein
MQLCPSETYGLAMPCYYSLTNTQISLQYLQKGVAITRIVTPFFALNGLSNKNGVILVAKESCGLTFRFSKGATAHKSAIAQQYPHI